MKRKSQTKNMAKLMLSVLLVAFTATAFAAPVHTHYLRAQPITRTMPGGEVIPMWGLAEYTDENFDVLVSEPNVPGPTLEIDHSDAELVVNLKNDLTVPISLVIPGLPAVMDPNFFTDDQGRQRVRSFTHLTQPGDTGIYTWSDLRPGTFLYHSGTHPSVQVPMGLYGAVTVDFNPSHKAYEQVDIDSDAMIFFSEIDPALNNAVATGNFGQGKAMTSTIDYEPKYFLINGRPYSKGALPIIAGDPETTIMLRFLNAGLESHVPVIQGLYMYVIAEDGHLYPVSSIRQQYSMLLAAGQTRDALIVPPPGDAFYNIYDRALNLTNNANSPGGMITKIQIGTPPINIAPVINAVTATPDQIPPGACTTTLSVDAIDPDTGPETPLVYSWSAQGCPGTFDDPTSPTAVFTFSKNPDPGFFTFTVYVSDGADTTVGTVDIEILSMPESPLIVDNRDATVIRDGTWLVSGGVNPYGTDSEYSRNAGDRFTFFGPRNGENLVEMRWTAFSNRSSNVTVQIWDGDTKFVPDLVVDQTANPSTWVTLGTYTFTGTAKVVVVSTGGAVSTNADAVRFTSTSQVFPESIQIVGPTIVGDAMPPTDYDIRIINSDGSTVITEATDWSVVDTGASIDAAGILTVPNVTTDTPAVITARYLAGGCTYTDTLDITIIDGIVATEVIVDNQGDTTQSGNWIVSGGVNPYGPDSVYSGTNGDTFTFNANLLNVPYAVYMHWTFWSNRRSSVPVRILDGATDTTVNVNQKSNPGMWNLLGVYTLGPNTQVIITSLGNGTTNADAVRFVPVSSLTELIIDNSDPGASATSGTWSKSAGANPYGSESLFSRSIDGTYTYIIDITGTFHIDTWWTHFSNRNTAVPYEIYDGNSPAPMGTVPMNQFLDGGGWNSVATNVSFSEFVRIVIRSTSTDLSTCADAIRLVPAGL